MASLYDEDGIDGPFEKGMAKPIRAVDIYRDGKNYVCPRCPLTTPIASAFMAHLEQHAMEGKHGNHGIRISQKAQK